LAVHTHRSGVDELGEAFSNVCRVVGFRIHDR